MLEFTDKKVATINIPVDITERDIEGIVVGAFEGGCNYWMGLDNSNEDWKQKPEGEPLSTWATKLLLEGKSIQFYDMENEDTDISDDLRQQWTMTLEKLLEGIKTNNLKRPKCSDKDNWDANDYDCIFQYALFGEIVYS